MRWTTAAYLTDVALYVAGLIAGVWLARDNLAFLLLAIVSQVKLGFIGHEGGHRAIDPRFFWLFQALGVSVAHWKAKHNHRHHTHPSAGTDGDIDSWPVACA